MIFLKVLLEQVIKEVGDLDNIKSFPYKKISVTEYQFFDEHENPVDVDFQKYDNWTIDHVNKVDFKSNILKHNVTYNVLYTLKGSQSQLYKSDYKTLVRILKTVLEIIKDFISQNNEVEMLTFYAGNKDQNKLLSVTDPQKTNLYKAILLKNISQYPGWTFADTKNDTSFKGFVLYKK